MRDYLNAPGLSKHALDYIHESPKSYRDYMDGKLQREKTKQMEFGSLFHGAVLEKRKDYVVAPEKIMDDQGEWQDWNPRTKLCRQWVERQTATILDRSEANDLEAMVCAVRNDPKCKFLMDEGGPEVSIFAACDGQRFKGRVDWLNQDYFVDLKTTTDASTDEFSKEIYNRRYHVQAALYLRIAEGLRMGANRFYLIAVQKPSKDCPVPRLNVRELSENAIDLGKWQLDDDLRLLNECRESGNWYDYSGKSETIGRIDVPAWAHAQYAARDLQLTAGGKSIF
jgi:hypothetical protein